MRRHIGITAAATLIALGTTACEDAYWGGKDNRDIYKGLINNFNTENGHFDSTLNCKGSDNCFWNEMHDGCSVNAEDNIQNLKILLAPNIKSDASERLVVICSKWVDGEDSYELVMDPDKGNLKIGQKGITDNGSVIIDIDKYNDWLCKSDSDRKLGRLTCDEITYYLYDGNTKKYSKCDKGKCGDLAKEMPEAFKNAFNYRVCPDGYDYRAKYIGDLTNVCVKSVCNGVSINLYTDNDNCGTCGYTCSSKGEGYTCVNGMCVSADKSKVLCKGEFINPENDPRYCGAKGDCSDTDRTSMDYSGMACVGATPLCSNGRCANACVGGQIVCDGRCVDPQTDMNFCGATGNCKDENVGEKCTDGRFCSGALCATSCQAGLFLCDDKCVDGTTNPYYCGVTSDCTETNNGTKCEDTQVCVSGKCEYNSCKEPETLCSTTGGNQCINIESDDADNCGSCGYKCSEHPVANATANGCAKGVCQYTCINNTENVGSDNTAANIRCVDTSTDVNNCGRKGKKCDPGQVCVNSNCVQNSCTKSNEILCATENGNTCKDVKSSDADNCGSCGYKCSEHPVANATANGCAMGVCQYTCINNTENVGGNNTAANIRCVDTSTDVNNCGGKGEKCASGQVCVNSVCVQNSCDKSKVLCSTTTGNDCIDIKSTDSNNCGTCGYKCADHPVANAEATGCVAGVCQYKCTGNTTNVGENKTAASIRCVDTSTDVNNCGGKGEKCASGQVCVNSVCVQNSCTKSDEILCATEHGNTCKDVKSSDADNCGACGYKCADHPVANATANGCVKGVCQYRCNNNTENVGIDNSANNIRCVDTSTDVNNCGGKGTKCESGQVCVNSNCVQNSCVEPLVLCSTTAGNQCIDIKSNDSNNCGACGFVCSSILPENASVQSCMKGVCQYECNNPYTNVGDGNSVEKLHCVNIKTDSNHCGRKDNKCTGGQICENGNCVCTGTQVYCGADNDDKNGQCVDPKTSSKYCDAKGKCNNPNVDSQDYQGALCDGDQVCTGGKCVKNSCNSAKPCREIQNGVNQCISGECKLSCNSGYVLNVEQNSCTMISDSVCGYSNGAPLNCTADKRNKHCDKNTLQCVECLAQEHCVSETNNASIVDCTAEKVCKIYQCNDGFVLHNNTCVPTVERCGSSAKNCKTDTPNLSNDSNAVACENGFCVVKLCTGNTHVYNPTNDGGVQTGHGQCEANSKDHCGSHDYKCNDANATNISCQNGFCKIEDCNGDYHVCTQKEGVNNVHDICHKNEIDKCGKSHENCSSFFNDPQCTNGVCSGSSCKDGYTKCDDGNKALCLKKGSGWLGGWTDECSNCVGASNCSNGKTCKRTTEWSGSHNYSCSDAK